MGYFQVRYDSGVVIYDRRGFIRLATVLINQLYSQSQGGYRIQYLGGFNCKNNQFCRPPPDRMTPGSFTNGRGATYGVISPPLPFPSTAWPLGCAKRIRWGELDILYQVLKFDPLEQNNKSDIQLFRQNNFSNDWIVISLQNSKAEMKK